MRIGTGRSAAKALDLRLYAIVDPEQTGNCAELARQVGLGGATLVQLRDKRSRTREMIGRAKEIKAALAGVSFLVNDRVDVAMAAGANGVHLGQEDMAVADARRLLGPAAIIGLSVKTVAEAAAAPLDLLDYVAIGGIYATSSKNNPGLPIGPSGLTRVIEALHAADFPVCAIAGIDLANAAEVIAAGADGIAVISALAQAPDPHAAARELRAIVDAALGVRDRR
jgi:thiamine-phosphate pyrophosphorylase